MIFEKKFNYGWSKVCMRVLTRQIRFLLFLRRSTVSVNLT